MKLADLINKKIIIYQTVEIDSQEVIKRGIEDGFDDEDIIDYIYELLGRWGNDKI